MAGGLLGRNMMYPMPRAAGFDVMQELTPQEEQRNLMVSMPEGGLSGLLGFLKGGPIMPDRKMNIPNIEDNAYEYQPRFNEPTGGSEYFNFGRDFDPSEGY